MEVALVSALASGIGLIAGWSLSQLSEWWRWRREDHARFAQQRRELYARFLIEATVIFEDLRQAAADAARAGTLRADGSVPADVGQVFVGAHRKLRQSEIELRLIAGSGAVVGTAGRLRAIALRAFRLMSSGNDPLDPKSEWPALGAELDAAVADFERASVEDLRIRGRDA